MLVVTTTELLRAITALGIPTRCWELPYRDHVYVWLDTNDWIATTKLATSTHQWHY